MCPKGQNLFPKRIIAKERKMSEFKLPHDHGNGSDVGCLHEKIADTDRFESVAKMLGVLSDGTRVRIFWLLSHREECVINISAMLGMSSPAVCHHLRVMKDSGIVTGRRVGKEVYYRITPNDSTEALHTVIEKIMEMECPLSHSHRNDDRNTAEKVHEYLITHISDRMTIEELSRKFLINPTTLKREFKAKYGNSLAAHMGEHRMERAAELLRDSDMSMSEIASAVGFSGQSRFTSAFKTHFGMTPTEYKKPTFLLEKKSRQKKSRQKKTL